MSTRMTTPLRRLVTTCLFILAPLGLRAAPCPPTAFDPRVAWPTLTGPVESVIADFTGDGVADIAVTASAYPDGPGYISLLPGLAPGGGVSGPCAEAARRVKRRAAGRVVFMAMEC